MEVNEPSAAYGQTYIQGLRSKLSAAIAATESEEKLERCLEFLGEDTMPGVYTDEEFVEEVWASNAGPTASDEQVRVFFGKWGC